MAKGPVITDAIKQLISEVYLDHKDWRAKEIEFEVKRRLRGKGPGLSAVQKLLTDIRRRSKESEDSGKGLEAPWSLGVSHKYNIPVDANQDLMKIWKWSTAAGLTLTIREAQWVARLRRLVRFELLFADAVAYAKRELACLLMGQAEMFTADLDIAIAAITDLRGPPKAEHGWVIWTARSFTEPVRHHIRSLVRSQLSSDFPDKASFAFMNVPAWQCVEEYLDLSPQHTGELPENAGIIYSFWLRRLAKGPKWQAMSRETKSEMAQRLYEHTNEAAQNLYEYVEERVKQLEDLEVEDVRPKLTMADVGPFPLPPQELFQAVGFGEEWKQRGPIVTYESERAGKRLPFKLELSATESEEDSDERSHSQEVQE